MHAKKYPVSFQMSSPGQAFTPISPHPELRELLFADQSLATVAGTLSSAQPPWDLFAAAARQVEAPDTCGARAPLRRILALPDQETRVHLLGWRALRKLGETPSDAEASRVRGVIIEVGSEVEIDSLAAYADHSARYLNQGGGPIIWEAHEVTLEAIVDALLEAAEGIVHATGLLAGPRPPPPAPGQAAISVLTYRGIHFGAGPLAGLSQDRLGGPVMTCGLTLIEALIARTAPGHQ